MKTLGPEDIRFTRKEPNRLSAILSDGAVLEDVQIASLFPLRNPESIISVYQGTGSERAEVGLVVEFESFSQEQQQMLRDYLAFSHFLPEIVEVMRIMHSAGVDEWNVVTDRGSKVFYLSDARNNIVVSDDGILLITDTDKCRYRITDYRRMRGRSRLLVERALP